MGALAEKINKKKKKKQKEQQNSKKPNKATNIKQLT
jgi:hypothetical protein